MAVVAGYIAAYPLHSALAASLTVISAAAVAKCGSVGGAIGSVGGAIEKGWTQLKRLKILKDKFVGLFRTEKPCKQKDCDEKYNVTEMSGHLKEHYDVNERKRELNNQRALMMEEGFGSDDEVIPLTGFGVLEH